MFEGYYINMDSCLLNVPIVSGAIVLDFTLLVGFSVGVYSTVFVAGALVVDMKRRLRHPRPGRQRLPI